MAAETKSLKTLLQETLVFIQRNFSSLLGVAAVVYVPLSALFSLFFWVVFLFNDKIDILSPHKSVLAVVIFIVFFAALVTIALLAIMVFSIAIIKALKACDEQKKIVFKDLYRSSAAILGPFCVVILWVFVKVSLWSLLFVIPGIVFAMFYSFAHIVFILDGRQGLSALKASRDIVQPFFWEFVGKSFVAGFLFCLASGLCTAVIHFVFQSNTGWDFIFASILENLTNGFLGIFPITFGYLLYKDLKERV